MDNKTIKELVNGLNLNKYYDSFKRYDDSDRYFVEIYAYKVFYQDTGQYVMYVGNRQRPMNITNDYTIDKYEVAEYWLNGNNDELIILHRYENTSNSLYDRYTHSGNKLANQPLLNRIKEEIVGVIKANFNVIIIPDELEISMQIAKNISEYKKSIKNILKSYEIEQFISDFEYVINAIRSNAIWWHKYLILRNRYWFISNNKNDVEERSILGFDSFTKEQQIITIVMKEWLAMVVNQSYVNPYYKMHIDKISAKLKESNFQNEELFLQSKSDFFSNKTAIKLILATMYKNSTAKQIEDKYKQFMNWRSNYMINIFK